MSYFCKKNLILKKNISMKGQQTTDNRQQTLSTTQILKSSNPQILKSSSPQILNPQILKSSDPQFLIKPLFLEINQIYLFFGAGHGGVEPAEVAVF